MIRILGLDLSLTATGLDLDGVTERLSPAPLPKGPSHDDEAGRIAWLQTALLERAGFVVDVIALEGFSYGSKGSSVDQIYGLGWAVRLAFRAVGLPYALVPPASLKQYATGKGNATKPDMRVALLQRFGLDERDDNIVDAIWLRLMALDAYSSPLIDMPKTHRAAIAKIAWPAIDGHQLAVA